MTEGGCLQAHKLFSEEPIVGEDVYIVEVDGAEVIWETTATGRC
jgi:hypothetical protein